MKWHELADQDCSIARGLAVIGDRWTLLILRDLFLGLRRFEQFRESLGISRTILSDRLNLLEAEGVIRRHSYQDRPPRHEYRLSRKGVDLYPVLMTLLAWGDKHYAGEAGPPILHRHNGCGHDFHAELHCSECKQAVSPFETEPRISENYPELAARARSLG